MEDRPMTFTEHLAELRTRLVRSVIAVLAAFIAAWAIHQPLFDALARPVLSGMRSHGIYSLQALQVTEAITVHLEIALVAALVLALPFLAWQAWAFVAPGLYERERRTVLPVVGLVSGFFLLGVAFCYFVFLPMVVDYLVGFTIGTGTVSLVPTLEKTFSLTVTFLLVFGLVFELPLLMFFLSLLGIVGWRKFLAFGRYFVVVAFVVAAVFTPPDPLSQVLMAVPLSVLYFVGLAFSWVAGRVRGAGDSRVAAGRWLVAGVFAFFASAVGLTAWAWDRAGGPPRDSDAVRPGAAFAVRAAPAPEIGGGVLSIAGVPGGYDAAGGTGVVLSGGPGGVTWAATGRDLACPQGLALPRVCVLAGDPPVGDPPAGFDVLDDEKAEVVFVADAACAARLLPAGRDPGRGMQADVVSTAGGNARMRLRFPGDDAATAALVSWVKTLRAELTPWKAPAGIEATPVGRLLAWTQGDVEAEVAHGAAEVRVAAAPLRVARMAGGLAVDLVAACGPSGGAR
jgi:sec-independent protein translocase protein TatC